MSSEKTAGAAPPRPRRKPRCPICGRLPTPIDRPFCSPRCRDEDLRRWLTGGYRIPGERAAGNDEDDDAR